MLPHSHQIPRWIGIISAAQLLRPKFGFWFAGLILTGITVISSGCHSHLPKTFRFDSNITEDGYKLFQLTFPPRDTELHLPSESRGNQNNQHLSESMVLSVLEQTLAENHYCREGFTLLGRYGGETSDRVRGECREKATDLDRKTYPNTIDRW